MPTVTTILPAILQGDELACEPFSLRDGENGSHTIRRWVCFGMMER